LIQRPIAISAAIAADIASAPLAVFFFGEAIVLFLACAPYHVEPELDHILDQKNTLR